MNLRLAATAGIVSILLAACGAAGQSGGSVSGGLSVFAAASLAGAFNQTARTFETQNPGVRVQFNVAGSATLAAQIQQGAAADVFASADQANMQQLAEAGLVDVPVTFARNKLEIVVGPGNPKRISGLSDFGRRDLVLVLCAPAVPCGRYAREAFSRAQIRVSPASQEQDVRSVITRIALGEADAGIVYQTDVRAAGKSVQGIAIPDELNIVASYPIAVMKQAKNPAAARAFLDFLESGLGQRDLLAFGFLPP
jgi:molybdate transport system substrate-binding protein